jgi:predicted TPR repeat methyltransferase
MDHVNYFDSLYADNTDPWHYETRWYEQRKRDICLALLLKPQYQQALELGCGNGVFSQFLATRCETLTCIDGHDQAVHLARRRLDHLSHVSIVHATIPQNLPAYGFDLIVISEILYYLSEAEIRAVVIWLHQHLNKDGLLLCCHWRYPISGFALTGEKVHALLKQDILFKHYLKLADTDFLVDVWHNSEVSLAMDEGLI